MDCKEVEALIYDYLDGELEAKRSSEMIVHLKACSHCFEPVEFNRILKLLVKNSADHPNADLPPLRERILQNLNKSES